jgi:hypothetical protein
VRQAFPLQVLDPRRYYWWLFRAFCSALRFLFFSRESLDISVGLIRDDLNCSKGPSLKTLPSVLTPSTHSYVVIVGAVVIGFFIYLASKKNSAAAGDGGIYVQQQQLQHMQPQQQMQPQHTLF